MRNETVDAKKIARTCEKHRLIQNKMRNKIKFVCKTLQNVAKRCDAKQLMQKNDAKYGEKCVFFSQKTKLMRSSCETDPVSHPFRINANFFFAKPAHPFSARPITPPIFSSFK